MFAFHLLVLSRVDAPDGVDSVGVLRFFVGAVFLDARKAKRKASRVTWAGLQIVEGDLDNKLRPNANRPIVARDFSVCRPARYFSSGPTGGCAGGRVIALDVFLTREVLFFATIVCS